MILNRSLQQFIVKQAQGVAYEDIPNAPPVNTETFTPAIWDKLTDRLQDKTRQAVMSGPTALFGAKDGPSETADPSLSILESDARRGYHRSAGDKDINYWLRDIADLPTVNSADIVSTYYGQNMSMEDLKAKLAPQQDIYQQMSPEDQAVVNKLWGPQDESQFKNVPVVALPSGW